MLSPLKPLLCRHDFYWSERHMSDRCRRCGKMQAVEVGAGAMVGLASLTSTPTPTPLSLEPLPEFRPAETDVFIDFEEPAARPAPRSPEMIRPSARALKAESRDRREALLALLDRLSEGHRPSREEAIDAVLAVMEDAHSADPVLFGPEAAGRFADLRRARSALRC